MAKLKVTIEEIRETVQVTDSFCKREVIFRDDATQYPQFISMQLVQDKCDLIQPFKVGEELEVDFNVNGRLWINPQGEKKYFNSLDIWRISKTPHEGAKPVAVAATTIIEDIEESEDLPF